MVVVRLSIIRINNFPYRAFFTIKFSTWTKHVKSFPGFKAHNFTFFLNAKSKRRFETPHEIMSMRANNLVNNGHASVFDLLQFRFWRPEFAHLQIIITLEFFQLKICSKIAQKMLRKFFRKCSKIAQKIAQNLLRMCSKMCSKCAQKCHKIGSIYRKLLENCSKTAQKLLKNCSKFGQNLVKNCSKIAQKIAQNCLENCSKIA